MTECITSGIVDAKNFLLSIGVMTGNSLDGADFVLTRFDEDETISDLKSLSVPMPAELKDGLRQLRACVEANEGHMKRAIQEFADKYKTTTNKTTSSSYKTSFFDFDHLIISYTKFIAQGIAQLIEKTKNSQMIFDHIDLIGFHGQTCAHCPPSIAKKKDPESVYTVQVGDGQLLSDLTGIAVVYDFRSDDIMNGGEGAPLAPAHHAHLAKVMWAKGKFPVVFCNAGNTGNLSIISKGPDNQDVVLGWDTGPFNHFSDKLMQQYLGKPYDKNGELAMKGRINIELLSALFNQSVVTADGDNFLLRQPPKSSDPSWYIDLPEMFPGSIAKRSTTNSAAFADIAFEDKLCTVQYLSAYIFVHSLTYLPAGLEAPAYFALSGGGWKNENIKRHFTNLLTDDLNKSVILPEHVELFKQLRLRLRGDSKNKVVVETSTNFGFDGASMEARLMADAAVCRVKGIPFSYQNTTGTNRDTIDGIIRFPQKDITKASMRLKKTLTDHQSLNLTLDKPELFDGRWSRASAGWFKRLQPEK